MQTDIGRELDELERLVAATRGMSAPSAVGNAQIVVSAGGIGVWIAAFFAAVSFVMVLVLGLLFLDHSRKIDDLGHYLNAIYQAAPQLQPEKETD